MKNLIYFLLFALILVGCKKDTTVDCDLTEQDVTSINALLELHKKNAMASDWHADALLYTEDAIRFAPDGTSIRGRKAIESSLKTVESVSSFTHKTLDINGGGNIAYYIVEYSMKGAAVGTDEPFKLTGKALAILKRQPDNSWKFHRVLWY